MRLVAASAALLVGLRRARGIYEDYIPPLTAYMVLRIVIYVAIGGLGGAWLARFLPELVAHLCGAPLPPLLHLRGEHWMGLLGGASFMGYIHCRRYHLPVGVSFDLFAPLAPLVLAIVRIGCLSAGCCYGKETTSWLALFLPDINGVWAYRYPTRIVSLIANLIIFALLLAFERYAARKHYPGWPFREFLFLLYVELYSLQRFYFEFWRGDMPHLVGPFTWTHLYCLIGIGLATRGILHRWRRKRNKEVISKRGLKCSGRSNIW